MTVRQGALRAYAGGPRPFPAHLDSGVMDKRSGGGRGLLLILLGMVAMFAVIVALAVWASR